MKLHLTGHHQSPSQMLEVEMDFEFLIPVIENNVSNNNISRDKDII